MILLVITALSYPLWLAVAVGALVAARRARRLPNGVAAQAATARWTVAATALTAVVLSLTVAAGLSPWPVYAVMLPWWGYASVLRIRLSRRAVQAISDRADREAAGPVPTLEELTALPGPGKNFP